MQAASLAAANTFALAWGAGGCSCPTPRRSKELGVGLTTLVFRFCQWLNPDCLEYRGGLAFPCSQQRCSQAWPIGSAPRVAHWRIVDGSAGCVLRDRRNWSSCYRTAEKRSLANINPLAVTVARKVAAIQFVFGKGGSRNHFIRTSSARRYVLEQILPRYHCSQPGLLKQTSAGDTRSVGQSAEKALEIHGTVSCPTSAQVIESSELVHSPRERQ